jgi:hypothetical protein
MPYLDQSKIGMPKDESDYNVWADYVELLVLLHPDRKMSVESLKDRLLDENDNDATKALKQINAVSRKIASVPIDQIAPDEVASEADPQDEQRIRTSFIGVVDYMKSRGTIIHEYYPFTIDGKLSVQLNKALTSKNKIYIILLISSLIRVIHRTGGHSFRITHRFETLCGFVFDLLVPAIAAKQYFGAGGPASERPEPAPSTFYQKVYELASNLNLPLHPHFTPEAAGVHNVGDGGLDWTAWFSFADNLHMKPTFFAQCACGNDWEEKLFDANKSKWNQFVLFNYDYKLYHFIPKSFRDLNNKWLNNIKLHSAILIDRFRLIELLEKSNNEEEVVALYSDLLEEVNNTSLLF